MCSYCGVTGVVHVLEVDLVRVGKLCFILVISS